MTVKYEDEVYECLKGRCLTTNQIINATGRKYQWVWTALTQLEQKGLVQQIKTGQPWHRVDELEDDQ